MRILAVFRAENPQLIPKNLHLNYPSSRFSHLCETLSAVAPADGRRRRSAASEDWTRANPAESGKIRRCSAARLISW